MTMQRQILHRVLCFLLVVVLLLCALRLTLEAKVSMSGTKFLHYREEKEIWARLAGPSAADNPQVLQILKEHFLAPPSLMPYNLSGPLRHKGSQDFTWPWIHEHLQKLFGEQHGGFFVEAGALDGEYLSNTLWMELRLGWTGLLVEPDGDSYKKLVSRHRRAWTSNTCLSTEAFPKNTILVSRSVLKGATHEDFWWAFRGQTHEMGVDFPNKESLELLTDAWYSNVQCFPLLSYLLALNVTTVDLLSLDVQGAEKAILHAFLTSSRVSQVSVRVIVVEDEKGTFDHAFMASHGYVHVASSLDHVYVKMGDPALRSINVTAATTATAAPTTTAVRHTAGADVTTTTQAA